MKPKRLLRPVALSCLMIGCGGEDSECPDGQVPEQDICVDAPPTKADCHFPNHWSDGACAFRLDWSGEDLSGGTYQGLSLGGLILSGTNLSDADLSDADLQFVIDLYDEEVLANDLAFGQLLERLHHRPGPHLDVRRLPSAFRSL